jgi:hypothetical protein
MQFLRASHFRVLRRLYIKTAVKSRCRVNYEEIVRRIKYGGSKNLKLFQQPVGNFDAERFAI